MAGIELLALRMARRIREHNEEVDRINNLSTNRDDVTPPLNKATTSEPAPTAQIEKSRFAQWAFYLIFLALGTLIAALFSLAMGLVPVATLSITGFLLLTSISLAVLSLRESR